MKALKFRFAFRPTPIFVAVLASLGSAATLADGSPQLSLIVNSNEMKLVNSPGLTCAQSTVDALRLNFGQISLVWSGTAPLEGSTIVVAFEDANIQSGQYVCEIDGKEFDAVFGTKNAEVAAHRTLRSVAGCNLQCGGIALVNPSAAFKAVGTITVLGLTQMGTSPNVQQQTTESITLDYRAPSSAP